MPPKKKSQSKDVLTTKDLAERWGLHRVTIDKWRMHDRGPKYLKLGGKVVYRLSDVEKFERENVVKTKG